MKGAGGMEISQVPAFEELTVGRRMMPCRQEAVKQCGKCWAKGKHCISGAQDVTIG